MLVHAFTLLEDGKNALAARALSDPVGEDDEHHTRAPADVAWNDRFRWIATSTSPGTA